MPPLSELSAQWRLERQECHWFIVQGQVRWGTKGHRVPPDLTDNHNLSLPGENPLKSTSTGVHMGVVFCLLEK